MTRDLARILAALKRELQALYGDRLQKVVLFGSQARGDAGPESDIDVLIVLRDLADPLEEISRTGRIVSRLSLENDTVIACVFTTPEMLETSGLPFYRNVRAEGAVV